MKDTELDLEEPKSILAYLKSMSKHSTNSIELSDSSSSSEDESNDATVKKKRARKEMS